MGMNRHDAYYEPEDDYMDDDQIHEEVADLMKDEYNPCNWGNFNEAFGATQNKEDIAFLEQALEKRDFEALGRKLWNMSYEYWEDFATKKVTGEF